MSTGGVPGPGPAPRPRAPCPGTGVHGPGRVPGASRAPGAQGPRARHVGPNPTASSNFVNKNCLRRMADYYFWLDLPAWLAVAWYYGLRYYDSWYLWFLMLLDESQLKFIHRDRRIFVCVLFSSD